MAVPGVVVNRSEIVFVYGRYVIICNAVMTRTQNVIRVHICVVAVGVAATMAILSTLTGKLYKLKCKKLLFANIIFCLKITLHTKNSIFILFY